MLVDVTHKGDDAHAPGQQQGGRVRLHGKAVAQGPPDPHRIAGLEFGHAPGAAPLNLEKTDHVTGGHVADAQGTSPGNFQAERGGPDHDELAGTPLLPFGMGQTQGEEAAFLAGLAEGHQIQHREQ